MAFSIKETTKIRNKIQNLDIDNNKEHKEIYERLRKDYLAVNEFTMHN